MRKLHKLLMAALVLVPLAACDEGDNSVTPDPVVGTVSGTVSVEGTGLAGVTVALAGASAQSTTTGANGGYSFANVVEGNYSVNLSSIPDGVVFSNTSQQVSISGTGSTASADFNGQYIRTASILVSVTAGSTGIATNVRLQGDGVDQTLGTNSNGQVQFSGLRAGSYTVSLPNPPEGFETTTQTVQLNTGQSAQVNFTGQAEITEAEVSIQSITQGGAPINLSNVAGQIEVTLNVDRGDETLDHVDVLIGGAVVASQSFASADLEGPVGAPVTITLNVPTAQVRMGANGQWVPVVFNGGRIVSANLFVLERESPTPSNEVPVVMQNADAILSTDLSLTPDEPERTATAAGGAAWFAGDATFTGPQFVAYSTVEPTAVAFTSSVCAGTSSFEGDYAEGLVVTASYDCSGVEAALSVSGPIVVTYPAGPGPDGTAIVPPTAFSGLGAQFTLESEMRRLVLSPDPGLTLPAALNMDNVGPTIYVDGEVGMPNAALKVAFNDLFDEPWVKADYMFIQDITTTDGGVGVDSTTIEGRLFAQADTSCTSTVIVTGGDLEQTIASDGTPDGYQMCGYVEDLLANPSVSGASNWFGVDTVAPAVRLHGTTAATPAITGTEPTSSATPVNDSVPNSTIYSMVADPSIPTLGPYDATMVWGLEALDSRSGFNQNGLVAGFPAMQMITQTDISGVDLTCAAEDQLSLGLSDTYVRTATETAFTCGLDEPGYYDYAGYVIDRAGNQSSTLNYNWLIDQAAAPSISFVSFDQTFYNVGEEAAFVIFGQDDLEVITADITLDYPTAGGTLSLYNSFEVGARWDGIHPFFDASAFTTAVTGVSVMIPNVLGRIDVTCDGGAGTPYASCAAIVGSLPVDPTEFNIGADDAAQLPTSVTPMAFIDAGYNASAAGAPVAINPLQWQSSTEEPWSAGNLITWTVATDGSNTVAQHMATTSIEDPFFDSVRLIRVDGTTAYHCGNFPAPVLTDNGLNRFWTYTMATPVAGSLCGDAAGLYWAMGIKGSAALITNPGTI